MVKRLSEVAAPAIDFQYEFDYVALYVPIRQSIEWYSDGGLPRGNEDQTPSYVRGSDLCEPWEIVWLYGALFLTLSKRAPGE